MTNKNIKRISDEWYKGEVKRKKEERDYDWTNIVPDRIQKAMRLAFLKREIFKLNEDRNFLAKDIINYGTRITSSEGENEWLQIFVEDDWIKWKKITNKMISMWREYDFLINYKKDIENKDTITQADIEEARSIPISNFANFNRGSFMQSFYSKDKTASLQYYPETNSYFCRSTNRGGDVIRFLMDKEGLDFITAVKRLVNK